MSNNEFLKKIKEIRKKTPEFIRRLPGIGKTEGLRFIADNFEAEGFEKKPGVYEKWPAKKTENARKKTLMGEKRGGSLKRGWGKDTRANTSQVEFTNSLPYAGIHNEGGKIAAHDIFPSEKKALSTPYGVFRKVKHPGSDIPQRQMIGDSEALTKRIEEKIDKEMEKLLTK